jgi:hypothetical protein
MKRIAFLALLTLCAGLAYARPVVLEPVATLPAPPGGYHRYGEHVAIDGDYVLITAFRFDPVDPANGEVVAALVYRRTAAGWVYDSTLVETEFNPGDISYVPTVALRDGFAAANFAGIFRRTASGWVQEAGSGGRGPDLEYSNGRFVFGTGEQDWGANVAERDATGTWRFTRLQGALRQGDNDNNGGALDIDGHTIAIAAPDVPEGEMRGPRIFRNRAGTTWGLHSRIDIPGDQLALRGNELFSDVSGPSGTWLYRDEWPGGDDWSSDWQFRQFLQTADAYMSLSSGGSLEKTPELLFQHRYSSDFGNWVYHAFRADEEGRYNHVATLVARDRQRLGGRLDVSGRRVIVGSAGFDPDSGTSNIVRIYELPAEGPYAATVLMDRFGTNSPPSYSHHSGNWVLATSAGQTVYRQQYLGGDARIIRNASQRTDGAIQVDVRPRAFNGNDRWFGLITRYVDAQNYYYVTVRSSGRIELRRMARGVFTTLDSQPFPVTLGRNYRLRLESVGGYHRVYVDDLRLLQAQDFTHAQGQLGVMTSRASADFDNLLITPNGYSTIYWSVPNPSLALWHAAGAWSVGANGVHAQTSTAGDARAIIGSASAEDQIVSVRARATVFNGSDRWFGAIVRYVDDRTHAYVSLRNSNRISLRRLVDGRIEVLAEAPLTVTDGTWFSLRVEALQHATNVYVNGELVLEGPRLQDGLTRGQVGLATYRAGAEFQDFLAYQP